VASKSDFHSIAPGQSLNRKITLGRLSTLTAIFREPGRYILYPTLNVPTHKMLDPQANRESNVENAWTGTLIGEPLDFQLTASEEKGSGSGIISGSIESADGLPLQDALVILQFSKLGGSDFDLIQGRVLDQVRSDKDGRFELDGVPEADFRLDASHLEHGHQSLPFSFAEYKRLVQPRI
jgi:hypothetical protein